MHPGPINRGVGEAQVGGVLDDPQLGAADALMHGGQVARGALVVTAADQQGRHRDLAQAVHDVPGLQGAGHGELARAVHRVVGRPGSPGLGEGAFQAARPGVQAADVLAVEAEDGGLVELSDRRSSVFRRRAGSLDERLPAGAKSLRRAAWAELQDSVPRAALLRSVRESRGPVRPLGSIRPLSSFGARVSTITSWRRRTLRYSRSDACRRTPVGAGERTTLRTGSAGPTPSWLCDAAT